MGVPGGVGIAAAKCNKWGYTALARFDIMAALLRPSDSNDRPMRTIAKHLYANRAMRGASVRAPGAIASREP